MKRPKIRVGSGLHNKPAGCGASEAYASGPDGEEEEEDIIRRETYNIAKKGAVSCINKYFRKVQGLFGMPSLSYTCMEQG